MPLDSHPLARALPDPRGEEFTSVLRQRLVANGQLDELAARRAERACQQSNERFDIVLARLGLVGEAALCEAVAAILSLPTVAADAWPLRAVFTDAVPENFLAANRMVILADTNEGRASRDSRPLQRGCPRSTRIPT